MLTGPRLIDGALVIVGSRKKSPIDRPRHSTYVSLHTAAPTTTVTSRKNKMERQGIDVLYAHSRSSDYRAFPELALLFARGLKTTGAVAPSLANFLLSFGSRLLILTMIDASPFDSVFETTNFDTADSVLPN